MRKKVISLVLVVIIMYIGALFGQGTKESTERQFNALSIGGAYMGTTAYQWSAALSEVIGKAIPGVMVTAEETRGYVANIGLFMNDEIEAGFTHAGLAHMAYMADGDFKDNAPGKFKAWFSMPAMIITIFTESKSNIKTFNDLAGKRVGVGQIGGSPNFDIKSLMIATGMTDKIKPLEVSIAEQSTMMQDGQIDVGIWCGSPPVPAIMELATTRNLFYVPLSKDVLDKVTTAYPFYYQSNLMPGDYPGIDHEIPSFAVQVTGLLRSDVPDDIAYKATKAVFENLEYLQQANVGFNQLSKETALKGLSLPLHPGVLKYYREIGVPGIEEYVRKTSSLIIN